MLTPRDILHTEFRHVMRGYSPTQVDEFLRRVVAEYETLAQENAKLKERVKHFEENNPEQAERMVEAARKEAEEIMTAARKEAEETMAAARHGADVEKQNLEALKAEEDAFRRRMTDMVQQYQALLNQGLDETTRLSSVVYSLREAAATNEE